LAPYVKKAPIKICDALYGGITEATETYRRVKNEEKIRYVDVISLYPYICKYAKFPVGYPKVYGGADSPHEFLTKEGVIICKVLPPKNVSSITSVI
jgi:hypothetical protein